MLSGKIIQLSSRIIEAKAFVWDWDNTIQFTGKLLDVAIDNFFTEFFKNHPNYKKIRFLIQETMRREKLSILELFKLIEVKIESGTYQVSWPRLYEQYVEYMTNFIEDHWYFGDMPVTEGALDLIKFAKKNKICQCVITNGTPLIKKLQMKLTGIDRCINMLFTSVSDDHMNLVFHKKIELLREFQRRNNLMPHQIVMIGDSVSDVQAAKENGSISVVLLHEESDIELFKYTGADIVVQRNFCKYNDLLKLLNLQDNFSLDKSQLSKVTDITESNPALLINGNKRISGEVRIGGSKHSSLLVLGALLAFEGHVRFTNFPYLSDVINFLEIYRSFGIEYEYDPHTAILEVINDLSKLRYSGEEIIRATRFRSSILLLGSALLRLTKIEFPLPGGDTFGKPRALEHFFQILDVFGIQHNCGEGGLIKAQINAPLKGDFLINFNHIKPDTTNNGTALAIILACGNEGKTVIKYPLIAPEIIELSWLLSHCGINIHLPNDDEMTIESKGLDSFPRFGLLKYDLSSDRSEIVFWQVAALLTGGNITTRLVSNNDRRLYARYIKNPSNKKIWEKIKAPHITATDDNGIYISNLTNNWKKLKPTTIEIKYREKVHFSLIPDALHQFMPLLSKIKGKSMMSDHKYGLPRLIAYKTLNQMGADIVPLEDKDAIQIQGSKKLSATKCETTDIRTTAILTLAALDAKGISTITTAKYLFRGYHDLVPKLISRGADVMLVDKNSKIKLDELMTPLASKEGILKSEHHFVKNRFYLPKNTYLPGVSLFLIDASQQNISVLLQLRSPSKHYSPQMWDISISGHLQTNENYFSALMRESKEETNFLLNLTESSLIEVGSQTINRHNYDQSKGRRIVRKIYLHFLSNDEIKMLDGMAKKWKKTRETTAWKWLDLSELLKINPLDFSFSKTLREIFQDKELVNTLTFIIKNNSQKS